MSTRQLIWPVAILCFGMISLITTSRATGRPADTTTLVVLYTSNTNGQLDACD